MLRLRVTFKVAEFLSRVGLFILYLGAGSAFYKDEGHRRRFQIRTSSRFNRWILRAFNVRVTVVGAERLPRDGHPMFLVSNHLADLDAMVHSSLYSAVFVTSEEVGESPFLGLLSRLGGSVFVERRQRFTLPGELNRLTDILNAGFPVMLYPEGTSTNGEMVLPFKNALFRAAIAAEAWLIPTCIQYQAIDGQPVTRANRDSVFYYGDMGFFSHLVRLCRLRSIDVQVSLLHPLRLKATDPRKRVAAWAQEVIAERYLPVS